MILSVAFYQECCVIRIMCRVAQARRQRRRDTRQTLYADRSCTGFL